MRERGEREATTAALPVTRLCPAKQNSQEREKTGTSEGGREIETDRDIETRKERRREKKEERAKGNT